MFTAIAPGLWIEERPVRFFGIETGTRMTIVKLQDGGLFVHSPVSLAGGTKEAVDTLGPVKAVVAPSLFHHLWVSEWIEAYPDAVVACCPGLDEKRDDLSWDRVLSDTPEPEWAGELDQVFFSSRSLENEVIFFHPTTRSMICADCIFHLSSHPSLLTRIVSFFIGNRKPGVTLLERFLIRDRSTARAQVDRMLAWDIERIILAHGQIIETNGHEVVRKAFTWL